MRVNFVLPKFHGGIYMHNKYIIKQGRERETDSSKCEIHICVLYEKRNEREK